MENEDLAKNNQQGIEENPFEKIMSIEKFYKGTIVIGFGLLIFLGILFVNFEDLYFRMFNH